MLQADNDGSYEFSWSQILSRSMWPLRYYKLFSWGYAFVPSQDIGIRCAMFCFVYYFQISIQFGMKLCRECDFAIQALYMKDYLQVPDEVDLSNINQLHHHVHGVDSMLGSLDCSHTIWKNCPKAWAGSYQGKENNPSIVLEDISDYHMFFGMLLMDTQVPLMTK
ncbi:hypothetical protein ACHAW6_005534 [Cyclotella cf. meneghiniana]